MNQNQDDKNYNAQAVEEEITQRWADANAYHATPSDSNPYAIVIPPPNVTAMLHIGHALNNTIQDVLIRWRRMCGDNTLWMPGTDHAGIATQTVVEKRVLAAEGKRRTDFERDEFVAKIQDWKDEYERRITEQLKAMGSSCDWERQRFTMDDVCSAAVREAFFRLFKDDLIYRGKRLVNWDPVTQTALADDEVEMEDVDGSFWYMKYPLEKPVTVNGETLTHVTVATTRPETMLGDTAVAINPESPYAEALKGAKVVLPIVNRMIPIVEDDYVVLPDPESSDEKAKYSSGFLKVTPAHDQNDWDVWQRHRDEMPGGAINVMAPDGSISRDHGWPDDDFSAAGPFAGDLLGKDRYVARKMIVKWFDENDLLAEIRPYRHTVGHSYRSHVPVEPYLSDQWYVRVTDDRLAGAALNAMATDQRADTDGCVWKDESSFNDRGKDWQGGLRFYPDRYAKTFQSWHENIRDWCISRQLWWGHRIPVWTVQIACSPSTETFGDMPNYFELRNKDYQQAVVAFRSVIEQAGIADDVEIREIPKQEQLQICTRNADVDSFFEALDAYAEKVAPLPGDERGTVAFTAYPDCDEAVRSIAKYLETVKRDTDVLDTWFSSALWPMSTLGWPNPEAFPEAFPEGSAALEKWNPSSTLCTAREIITLWVSRMVMFNLYLRDCLPFKDVFIHAMIQDGEGQKMSKSLGNGVDPLDIVHSHGADALRFTLAHMTTHTQDVRMPVDTVCPFTGEAFAPKTKRTKAGHVVAAPTQQCPSDPNKQMVTSFGVASGEAEPTDSMPLARNSSPKFDGGRNFCNKLWNAGRFAMQNLEQGVTLDTVELSLADRWILSRLSRTILDVNKSLTGFQFNSYVQVAYDFFWRDLCDWYLEAIKPIVRTDTPAGLAARQTLAINLDVMLRVMHPVIPYITEKMWSSLNEVAPTRGRDGFDLPASDMCIQAAWPQPSQSFVDEDAEAQFELVRDIVSTVRNIRSEYGVKPKDTVGIQLKAETSQAALITASQSIIEQLATVSVNAIGSDVTQPDDAVVGVVSSSVSVFVEGLIDAEAESDRLQKRIDELNKNRNALSGRLNNKGYVDKAPAHLVQQTRDQLAEVEQEIQTVEEQLKRLA